MRRNWLSLPEASFSAMARRRSTTSGQDHRAARLTWPGGDTHAGRFGRYGEECAARWYRSMGCQILAENWRCAEGELDLIVADGSAVVFVEVKARTSSRFGTGADAVDHRKQRKLRLLASRWLAASDHHFADLRFDVVDVDARGTVQVFEDCF